MRKILSNIINKETILYLVFGIGTTIVNFVSFAISNSIMGKEYYLISNVISFVAATGFAFVTNKIWVFESTGKKILTWLKELVSFVTARIATFIIIEEIGLWFMVQVVAVGEMQILGFDGIMLAKIFLAFVAVLVNYILSKFVFKKK